MSDVKCISCNSSLELVAVPYSYESDSFRNLFPGLEIVTCKFCSLSQVPRGSISDASLTGYYRSMYRGKVGIAAGQDPKIVSWFRARGKAFAKMASQEFSGTPSSVLEVGCGYGYNLLAMAECYPGTKLYGFDPDETVRLPEGVLPPSPSESFDIIIMSHVLEHLIDPSEELSKWNGRLRSGGVLLIEVPNDTLYMISQYGKTLEAHEPHLTFFSKGSLAHLLERSFPGRVRSVNESGPSWIWEISRRAVPRSRFLNRLNEMIGTPERLWRQGLDSVASLRENPDGMFLRAVIGKDV